MTVNHDVAGSSPAWGATSKNPNSLGFGFFVLFAKISVRCDDKDITAASAANTNLQSAYR